MQLPIAMAIVNEFDYRYLLDNKLQIELC